MVQGCWSRIQDTADCHLWKLHWYAHSKIAVLEREMEVDMWLWRNTPSLGIAAWTSSSIGTIGRERIARANKPVLEQTRSALSPARSPSVAVSSPAPSYQPRCTAHSSSAASTSTSSPSTPDMRRGTRTLLHTSVQHSVLRRVTRSLLASADL